MQNKAAGLEIGEILHENSTSSLESSIASSQSALASSIVLNQNILDTINNDSFLFQSAQDRKNEREQQAAKRQVSRKLALKRQVLAQTNAADALAQESPRTSETTSHAVPKKLKRPIAVTTIGRVLHDPNSKTQKKNKI